MILVFCHCTFYMTKRDVNVNIDTSDLLYEDRPMLSLKKGDKFLSLFETAISF